MSELRGAGSRVRATGETTTHQMSDSAAVDLKADFARQLADDDAQAGRERYCRTTANALDSSGAILDLAGSVLGDESAQALGLVARIGAALAQGAVAVLSASNAYAAAALIRQLVEVEYLLWTFDDDLAEAAAWLHANPRERQRSFGPAAMRKRSDGRFRDKEYDEHCAHGGHPNPKARTLLDPSPLAPVSPLDATRAMWVDLGHHLQRAWSLLSAASATAGYGDFTQDGARIESERRAWHKCDPLAQRIPIPPSTA